MIGWLALAMAAQAAPAATADIVPATPAAVVAKHVVTHRGDRIAVHVPASATYVGHDRFNLYGVADAEIHVFVDADRNKRAKRLYWIQFESYLPSLPNNHYNYADGNTRMTLWGTPTWVNAGPQRTTGPTRPGSDTEHVRTLLTKAGYKVPPEAMSVRLVQILDDPKGTGRGRRELMIIYSEDLALSGKHYSDLAAENGETRDAAWKPLEQPLINRAAKAVRVERK